MTRGQPQLFCVHPRIQGSHGTRPLHRPLVLPELGHLDRMLPLFCRYYCPRQQLSLDEGMIPTQEPPRHQAVHMRQASLMGHQELPAVGGQATFSRTATGPSLDQPAVLSAVSWRTRRSPTRTTCSVELFHLLKNELGLLAAGTVMPSRKHYPKELGKRLTECGRYEFRCWGGLCAIT